MSYQHFYSRVPARVSLYNKIDGFDTFAHSSGLDREFVLGELRAAYADKLSLYDQMKVRRGEIPTVYSQVLLPSGRVVQTALSYLPLDFTGERSAYFVHSLVLTEEERAAIFSGSDCCTLNTDMFVTDASSFEITAPYAAANPAYPEKSQIRAFLGDARSVLGMYNPEMVKSFVFAVIKSVIGGGSDVYFRLPVPDASASLEAMRFINAVMSLLPYSVRERLSFVTYVNGPDSYRGFKLKYACSDCERIFPHKGAFYDFSTGTVTGQPEDFERNISLASFIYSLLDNKKVRDGFQVFVSNIERSYSLSLDIKSLNEIIYMFWQCSGFYVERSVLPTDEAVYNFLEIYEKYREGLIPAHRIQAYRCLGRYASAQTAIPEKIFSLLSRIYPDEIVPAKAVALDTLLSLIHAPAMREDLFAFISSNFDTETDGVKAAVIGNLARVFYGGFLQHHILQFFDQKFGREPVSSRDVILDKLLLSIRTPEVQRQIVSFIDRHYAELNQAQRLKVYTTCLEMIPQCDGLSLMLVNLINRRIAVEGGEIQKFISTKLCEILDLSLKAGDARLTAIMMENSGFCADLAAAYIWKHRIGGDIFIGTLARMGAHKRASKLIHMYKTLPDLTDAEYEDLLSTFTETAVSVAPSTMYEIMQADRMAGAVLPDRIAEHFRRTIIYPTVVHTYLDVFKVRYGKDGVNTMLEYTEGNDLLCVGEPYRVVKKYVSMVEKCKSSDTEGAFRIAAAIPDEGTLKQQISDHIRMCALDTAEQSNATALTFELLINYFKGGNFRFDALYSKYRRRIENDSDEQSAVKEFIDPTDRRAAAESMELLLSCIAEICDASGSFVSLVFSESSGIRRALTEFIGVYGVGAWLFIKKHGEGCPDRLFELASELAKERYSAISSFDDAVDFILRR